MATVQTSTDGLRVVVAEAHPLLRHGLVAVLSAAGSIVSAVADSDAALRAVGEQHAQALLVNLALPGNERGHVVAIARDRWPELAIVALSAAPDHAAMLAAMDLGASAYLPSTVAAEQVLSTLAQAVSAPSAFLADDLLAPRRQARGGPRLTRRESDVLALAAEGLTVAGISERLYVSPATTRSHLSGIYRKLGVTSRSQAVLAAERLGMLTEVRRVAGFE